jgi:hypothetical protein
VTHSSVAGAAISGETSGLSAYGVTGTATATTGATTGVLGSSSSTQGRGVVGVNTATSGITRGVRGEVASTEGRAMEAISTATAGNARALLAQCASPDGIAIEAISTATSGSTRGVRGLIASHSGCAMEAIATATTGTACALLAKCASPNGMAIQAETTATAGNARALQAYCESATGVAIESFSKGVAGVKGVAIGPNAGAGLWGVQSSSSPSSVAIYGEGKLQVTGTKNFVQPHPGDAGRNIVFTCLEGNESGTYFRGSARLTGGRAEIAIPEEWRLASEAQGITVQVTPIRSFARLMVFEQSRERIVIAGDQDCEFHYLVNGVRRGYARHVSFVENHQYRPVVKQVPFGMQYPKELRDVLVGNGILNADYTPNEATAARLGWTLKEQHEVPVAERWWLAAEERQALWNAELAERKE